MDSDEHFPSAADSVITLQQLAVTLGVTVQTPYDLRSQGRDLPGSGSAGSGRGAWAPTSWRTTPGPGRRGHGRCAGRGHAVFSTHSYGMVDAFSRMVRPFGQVVAIDELGDSIDALKPKSIAWHWELMFTRPSTGYDLLSQGRLLDEAATLFDSGTLKTAATTMIQGFTAENLRKAHALVEHGGSQGEVVVR